MKNALSKSGILIILLVCAAAVTLSAQDKTIIDEWTTVGIPPAPKLKEVTLGAQTTAFLILDIQKRSCTAENRPRCASSIPKVQAFLKLCRDKGVFVAYSLTGSAKPEDIVPELEAQPGEPVVRSGVDKFYKTELEKLLADKGIKTVVVAGTSAHGAVLYTATGASLRGLKVVVPVDGMSADQAFPEQYTAWHLLNSPGTRRNTTLTRFSMIRFE